jgi:hypothetical protein
LRLGRYGKLIGGAPAPAPTSHPTSALRPSSAYTAPSPLALSEAGSTRRKAAVLLLLLLLLLWKASKILLGKARWAREAGIDRPAESGRHLCEELCLHRQQLLDVRGVHGGAAVHWGYCAYATAVHVVAWTGTTCDAIDLGLDV